MNEKVRELLAHVKKLKAEQDELLKKLEKSLAIQEEFPGMFENETVKFHHRGMMMPNSRQIGIVEAYILTEKGMKFPVSKELLTKLTGKTLFHPNYNKRFKEETK